MSREIKFRGWDIHNKKMVRVCEIDWVNGDYIKEVNTETYCHDYTMREKTVVLMQYTGLKDKNGKEIFERDILRDTITNQVAAVKYHPGYFSCGGIMGCDELSQGEMKHEIIGNLFENPELLR